ncbi:MAG TPA: hypothetical protein VND94_21850 [Terriglobia bacterium]|nr:hypothetical protein [Terriglobia bacterium]
MMKLIYDDAIAVTPEVTDIVGIRHYGDLLHGKRRLSSIVREAAEGAGIEDVVHFRRLEDLRALADGIDSQQVGRRFLYLPSNVIALGGKMALTALFGKLRWLRQNVLVTAAGGDTHGSATGANAWSGAAALDLEAFRRLIEQRCQGVIQPVHGERRGNFADIGNGANLVDLSDKAYLLKFLGSHFEVRHFNAISFDDYTIRKSSRNKEKIRQEYTYWGLLPDRMKFWFVQPYDLVEEGETASYAMERLHIPDMALQWVHGAVTPGSFDRFLDRAFHFLQQRPSQRIDRDAAVSLRRSLYRDKLATRMADLRKTMPASQIELLLRSTGTATVTDSLAGLLERYAVLLEKLERRRSDQIAVIGHGDFCFSNILYEKNSNLIRLIDPRGAARPEDLWTDPYYDLAKLSHSILGNYDFINNGLYDLVLDDGLRPRLELHIETDLGEMQQAFKGRLASHGFDLELVRLYEASLFLSMVPLHIDIPSKALAFLINAEEILTKLENGEAA